MQPRWLVPIFATQTHVQPELEWLTATTLRITVPESTSVNLHQVRFENIRVEIAFSGSRR